MWAIKELSLLVFSEQKIHTDRLETCETEICGTMIGAREWKRFLVFIVPFIEAILRS